MIVSLQPKKRILLPSIVIYILILLGVLIGLFFLIKNYGSSLGGKSQLLVDSLNGAASVYMDDKFLGVTPVDSKEVSSREHKVSVKNDIRQYETSIKFVSGTGVVLNRDIGVSDIFSSGQNFWMEKESADTVLSIVSDPSEAMVYIDNTDVGETPYISSSLSEGEYDLRVEKLGYETQTARINIKKGYKLNVSLNLFPLPVSSEVSLLEGSTDLYGIFSDNVLVTSDTKGWVQALIYWNKTRGINLADLGLNKELVFDFFIDYRGNVYAKDGIQLSGTEEYARLENASKGAYLGRVSDGAGLTQDAKDVYKLLTGGVIGSKRATIQPTGLGWLRVRSTPGLNGAEVGRATVGESYAVLEEVSGWVKIRVSESLEGWVSADYVELSK